VFLIHGFMDAAGTWDRVAPTLAAAGHRVIAPHMRGFGEGPRAPSGAYYHFPDYVADLDGLVRHFAPEGQVSLVGHSMGGTVVTLFAGSSPERVRTLVSIEGLGPPDNGFDMGPVRMRRWLDDLQALRPAVAIKREDARRRFGMAHSYVPADILDHRFPYLVEDVGDGMVKWRYDPLHRTTSPMPFFAELLKEYAKKVTCPVTFVSGGAAPVFGKPQPVTRTRTRRARKRARRIMRSILSRGASRGRPGGSSGPCGRRPRA